MLVAIRYWPLMVLFFSVSFSSFLASFTSAWAVIFRLLVAELVAEISTLPLDSTLAFSPMVTVALASLSSTRILILPRKFLALSEIFLPIPVFSMVSAMLLATVFFLSVVCDALLLSWLPLWPASLLSSAGALKTLPVNLVVALAEISVSPPLTVPSIFTEAVALASFRFNREALSALAWLRSTVLVFSALISTLWVSASTVPFSATLTLLTANRLIVPSSLLVS